MPHLSTEILRRYVDEPDVLLSFEKAHLLKCLSCRDRLDRCRANADFADAAFTNDTGVDLSNAHRAVLAQANERAVDPRGLRYEPHAQRAAFAPWRHSRLARWSAIAATLAMLAFITVESPLRTYAQTFLTIFEPRGFQAVGLTSSDLSKLQALPNLTAFGTMHGSARAHFTEFNNAQATARAAAMPIAAAGYLPSGVPHRARYQVSAAVTARFTFSAAKARAFAQHRRVALPAMTDQLDGATLSASMGPFIIQTIGSGRGLLMSERRKARANQSGLQELPSDTIIVSQARAPKVRSSRATTGQIESYLLALPGVPRDFAMQIRAIGDPNHTLPVPFRIDKETARQVSVHGAVGLLVGDNTGIGSGVMWQQGGTVYGVAGPFSAEEILRVANSLKM